MTVAETISQLAIKAAGPLTDLAVAAFGALVVKLTLWVHAHTKNKLILDMTDRATTEAKSAVAAAAQTVVSDLKAKAPDSKLSLEDAAKIKADVLAQVTANLGGEKWVDKAQSILGVTDIEAFLSTKIEAAVQQLSAPPVVVAAPVVVAPAVPAAASTR